MSVFITFLFISISPLSSLVPHPLPFLLVFTLVALLWSTHEYHHMPCNFGTCSCVAFLLCSIPRRMYQPSKRTSRDLDGGSMSSLLAKSDGSLSVSTTAGMMTPRVRDRIGISRYHFQYCSELFRSLLGMPRGNGPAPIFLIGPLCSCWR